MIFAKTENLSIYKITRFEYSNCEFLLIKLTKIEHFIKYPTVPKALYTHTQCMCLSHFYKSKGLKGYCCTPGYFMIASFVTDSQTSTDHLQGLALGIAVKQQILPSEEIKPQTCK